MNLEYTTTTPTEPGWYWLKYRGYRSRRIIESPVELGFPEGGMLPSNKLAIKSYDPRYRDYHFNEINFHPDCRPLLWAGPIEKPKRRGWRK